MSNSKKGLSVSALSVAYGKEVVLEDLFLSIEPSELVVIVGASGCGKTTFLRAIAGLVEVTSGEIQLNGKNITSIPAVRRNVGMVFQDYALYSSRTVFENIEFPLRMRGISKRQRAEKVNNLLDRLKLNKLAKRYASNLSGGEQQRVALARALVKSPDILLLDEPLSNVDNEQQENLRVLIKTIKNNLGVPTVHVTHNQIEAWRIADRIGVMYNKRVIQVGSPEQLFNNPKNTHVARLVGDLEFNMININDLNSQNIQRVLLRWPTAEIIGFRANEAFMIKEENNERKESNNIIIDLTIKESERYGGKYRYIAKIGGKDIKLYFNNTKEIDRETNISVVIPLSKIYIFSKGEQLLKGRE